MSSVPQSSQPKPSFSVVRVLLVAIPLGFLCGWLMKSYFPQHIEAESNRQGSEKLQNMILRTDGQLKLDPRFTDADGDLIADPPKDPAQLISPDVLVFSFIAGPNAEKERDDWKPLTESLAAKTSKRVEIVSYPTIGEQLAAFKSGKLHITGLNTGTVCQAVTECGFVPICAPGRDDGTFGYKMEIIVPAKSAIKALGDLKGATITFTDRNSNSGYKAALVTLMQAGLLPQRDYDWRFSTDHLASIRGIATGEFQAAPIASDMLQRAITDGDAKEDQIRVIAQSENFPPAVIGYVYNLNPELAAKVKDVLLQFALSDGNLKKQFADSTKFVPISYKNDFKMIRTIDETVKATPDASTIVEPTSSPDAPADSEPPKKSG